MRRLATCGALLLVTGCASLPQQDADLLARVRAQAAADVAVFNSLRGQHMPVPVVVFADLGPAYGDVVTWREPVRIDAAHCREDVDDCLRDTVPHELAHWALSWYGYYGTRREGLPTGGVRVYETRGVHDGVWCDTMRAMGGDPAKHGYSCGG